MVLQWTPPADLGGCSVTGYAVFRDGGDVASAASPGVGVLEELNSASDVAVRNKPSLNTLTATSWPAGTVGQAFRLQIQVFTT
jgi:hypothetical protein